MSEKKLIDPRMNPGTGKYQFSKRVPPKPPELYRGINPTGRICYGYSKKDEEAPKKSYDYRDSEDWRKKNPGKYVED